MLAIGRLGSWKNSIAMRDGIDRRSGALVAGDTTLRGNRMMQSVALLTNCSLMSESTRVY